MGGALFRRFLQLRNRPIPCVGLASSVFQFRGRRGPAFQVVALVALSFILVCLVLVRRFFYWFLVFSAARCSWRARADWLRRILPGGFASGSSDHHLLARQQGELWSLFDLGAECSLALPLPLSCYPASCCVAKPPCLFCILGYRLILRYSST